MTVDGNSQFYENLPVLESFFLISNPENYHSLPPDWYVGVTDIENSTDAIKKNQYKTVNILGASPIIGLLNKTNSDALPYSFGGDGCSICFPKSLVNEARSVFAASQQIGKEEYGLSLRAAIIPVSVINEHGYKVNVARFRVSDVYTQAVFSGGGLNFAEKLLKNPVDLTYHLSVDERAEDADFSGLECRWQEVKPPGKSVISILVQSNPEIESPDAIYEKVLKKLRDIFGFDDTTNPVIASQLKMHISVPRLLAETKFRTFGKGWPARLKYIVKAEAQIFLGKILMRLGYQSSATNWKQYKPDLALNSDHRKFDDMLRLVISGTPRQHAELEHFLEELFEKKELAYGIHSTESAIITCMVFAYQRQHIHFIDGSNGGYVKASIGLKKRLNALQVK